MNNLKIREKAMRKNVKHWEIAQALDISETWFCVMLRKELPTEKQEHILTVIDDIAKQKWGEN
jgi:hypothetical protein